MSGETTWPRRRLNARAWITSSSWLWRCISSACHGRSDHQAPLTELIDSTEGAWSLYSLHQLVYRMLCVKTLARWRVGALTMSRIYATCLPSTLLWENQANAVALLSIRKHDRSPRCAGPNCQFAIRSVRIMASLVRSLKPRSSLLGGHGQSRTKDLVLTQIVAVKACNATKHTSPSDTDDFRHVLKRSVQFVGCVECPEAGQSDSIYAGCCAVGHRYSYHQLLSSWQSEQKDI